MNIDDTHRKRLKLNKKWIRCWNIILFIISIMKIKWQWKNIILDFKCCIQGSISSFWFSSCLYLKEDSLNIIIFMMKIKRHSKIYNKKNSYTNTSMLCLKFKSVLHIPLIQASWFSNWFVFERIITNSHIIKKNIHWRIYKKETKF